MESSEDNKIIIESHNQSNLEEKVPFYVISSSKFWVLNVLTLGCFYIVWFYMQWLRQNQAGREKVSPFWRTMFMIFFYHSLVRKIKEQTQITKVSELWNANLLANLIVFTIIIERICFRNASYLERMGKDASLSNTFGFALLLMVVFLSWQIQRKINLGYDNADGKTNSKITLRNILWVILFWVAIIAAVFGTAIYL